MVLNATFNNISVIIFNYRGVEVGGVDPTPPPQKKNNKKNHLIYPKLHSSRGLEIVIITLRKVQMDRKNLLYIVIFDEYILSNYITFLNSSHIRYPYVAIWLTYWWKLLPHQLHQPTPSTNQPTTIKLFNLFLVDFWSFNDMYFFLEVTIFVKHIELALINVPTYCF